MVKTDTVSGEANDDKRTDHISKPIVQLDSRAVAVAEGVGTMVKTGTVSGDTTLASPEANATPARRFQPRVGALVTVSAEAAHETRTLGVIEAIQGLEEGSDEVTIRVAICEFLCLN